MKSTFLSVLIIKSAYLLAFVNHYQYKSYASNYLQLHGMVDGKKHPSIDSSGAVLWIKDTVQSLKPSPSWHLQDDMDSNIWTNLTKLLSPVSQLLPDGPPTLFHLPSRCHSKPSTIFHLVLILSPPHKGLFTSGFPKIHSTVLLPSITW